MEEKKTPAPESAKERKLTYEELETVAHQLNNQVQDLYRRLNEENVSRMFKRLDYLFKVVEHSIEFPSEFVGQVVKEIMEAMTIPDTPETTEPKDSEVPTE